MPPLTMGKGNSREKTQKAHKINIFCVSCAFSRRHYRFPSGYLAGPPELIEEVAASSASIDLRDKRRAYCRNGVREYLVWLGAEARLEWFCLEEDDYRPQLPDAQGVLHSRIFPGLQLPVASLLAGDPAKVLAALTSTDSETAENG